MKKDMIMRPLSFKCVALPFLLFFMSSSPSVAAAAGMDVDADSLITAVQVTDIQPQDTVVTYGWDRRVHRYRKAFSALIPTQNKLQFYGDMGLVSVGFGWDYGRHAQWETDILFGIIPKYNSSSAKVTMTLKQTFIPWSIYVGKRFSIEPLHCGVYLNTVFSNKFWTRSPERYPKGYYWFSTRVRAHIFLGQSVTYDIPHNKRLFVKSVSAFYEISSCDLYIASAFTNKSLTPKDYLRLSFGLKFRIF